MSRAPKLVVLSWDPPNAWCLTQGEALLARGHWTMTGKSDGWLAEKVLAILDFLPCQPDIIVVEGQYLHVHGDDAPHVKRGKQRGSLVLSWRAGIIAGVCMAILRQPVRKRDPDEWQQAMVGGGRRDERKKMSLIRARDMTGQKLTVDESDAYLMAVYEGIQG